MVSSQPFARLLSAETDGRCQSVRYRQDQFHRLQSALVGNIDQIKDAIEKDSGHSPEEIQAEICLALREVKTHYMSLNFERELVAEYRIANGKDNADAKRGAGIVYIVPCAHTLFFSALCALAAAMAAGNSVIIELTQTTTAVPALLRTILSQALDADTFAISDSRPDAVFLNKVMMIIQSDDDSAHVPSRSLLSTTTTTMAVVDRSADIAHAAEALVEARFLFGGRSPYSPDVVFVHEFAIKPFVEAVMQHASKYLAGQDGRARESAGARKSLSLPLLDAAHKDPGSRVLVSGSSWGVVEVHDRKSALLQKKVEGKVLLLHAVSSIDDAIDLSNSFGTLAATFAFAAPATAKYLTQFMDARISWVNHVPVEMLIGPTLSEAAPPCFETRYSVSLLQVPRPEILSETQNAALVKAVLDTANRKKVRSLWSQAIAPLPPTKQKDAESTIGFFEQGIITGGIITLFSFVATMSTLGYYTFTYVRRM